MSKVARNLLDEFVEPTIKRSYKDKEPKRYSDYKYVHRVPSKQDNTIRTIVVEKKKVINKLVPNDFSASRTKFKSKETLLKKAFVDIAVNTTVTGPLRCDNTCVTMVRKRDNTFTCRCGQKRLNYKSSAKLVQTLGARNFPFMDKACDHYIETATCGTQFLQKQSRDKLKSQMSTGPSLRRSHKEILQSISFKGMPEYNTRDMGQATSGHFGKQTNSNLYMGARRWALSHYPTRGPDF